MSSNKYDDLEESRRDKIPNYDDGIRKEQGYEQNMMYRAYMHYRKKV